MRVCSDSDEGRKRSSRGHRSDSEKKAKRKRWKKRLKDKSDEESERQGKERKRSSRRVSREDREREEERKRRRRREEKKKSKSHNDDKQRERKSRKRKESSRSRRRKKEKNTRVSVPSSSTSDSPSSLSSSSSSKYTSSAISTTSQSSLSASSGGDDSSPNDAFTETDTRSSRRGGGRSEGGGKCRDPDEDPREVVSQVVRHFPRVAEDLSLLLSNIHKGQAVDIAGLPDVKLRSALERIFLSLGMKRKSKLPGVYYHRRGACSVGVQEEKQLFEDLHESCRNGGWKGVKKEEGEGGRGKKDKKKGGWKVGGVGGGEREEEEGSHGNRLLCGEQVGPGSSPSISKKRKLEGEMRKGEGGVDGSQGSKTAPGRNCKIMVMNECMKDDHIQFATRKKRHGREVGTSKGDVDKDQHFRVSVAAPARSSGTCCGITTTAGGPDDLNGVLTSEVMAGKKGVGRGDDAEEATVFQGPSLPPPPPPPPDVSMDDWDPDSREEDPTATTTTATATATATTTANIERTAAAAAAAAEAEEEEEEERRRLASRAAAAAEEEEEEEERRRLASRAAAAAAAAEEEEERRRFASRGASTAAAAAAVAEGISGGGGITENISPAERSAKTDQPKKRVIGPAMPPASVLEAAARLTEASEALQDELDGGPLIGPAPPAAVKEAENATEEERFSEVARIIQSGTKNPYELMGVANDASANEIKKKYWKLSLLIHPDKCAHPQAQEAFALLNKTHLELQEPGKRAAIDDKIEQQRSREEFQAELKRLREAAQWRKVRGEALPGDDQLLGGGGESSGGVLNRDTWMTDLPAERSAGYVPSQKSTFFSKKGKHERGDTSGWTDTPAQRMEKAKKMYLEAYQQASIDAPADFTPRETAETEKTAHLVDEFNARNRSMALVDKHQDEIKAKKKKKKKENKNTAEVEEEEWVGKHPWKPWDREKDLVIGPKAMSWDKNKQAASLASRFGSDDSGQRHFL